MHSKQTVRYLCQIYPSGNEYYFKEEIITHDSWDNLNSLEWGRRRPVTKETFEKRRREGYRVHRTFIDKPMGQLLHFPLSNQHEIEETGRK
ncbi:hypothetical protein [Alteribacter natronophilus]|uniref:hypothetical protein n=1 Tax=Alteribacter natronophilus TaxID=2583810 RepID=UPI00110EB18A|nr:hypothetical protein [Alteribacter natronophilus]TMW73711.1 hypothetical protein FGB90_05305 [Alteribacter natronophilus]